MIPGHKSPDSIATARLNPAPDAPAPQRANTWNIAGPGSARKPSPKLERREYRDVPRYRAAPDGWRARRSACANRYLSRRPSPPLPPDCEPLENRSPPARSAPPPQSTTQMPNAAARAAAAWRPCRSHSPNTGLATRRVSKDVARLGGGLRSGQPRCARGNLKAVAEGDNEDDEGEVRSERSGPQSWAPTAQAAAQTGGLRSTQSPQQSKFPAHNKKRRPKKGAVFQASKQVQRFCFNCDKSRTAPRSAEVANAA